MDNKILGVILIITCLLIGGLIYSFNKSIQDRSDSLCSCSDSFGKSTCPHAEQNNLPIYFGIAIVSGLAALGIYLIFFERSQKEIVKTLENQKRVQTEDEKFKILSKGLSKEEKKIISAVREQDGITQATLSLRTSIHKTKLSILLDGLEKKYLIARKPKGRTKQVFLKVLS